LSAIFDFAPEALVVPHHQFVKALDGPPNSLDKLRAVLMISQVVEIGDIENTLYQATH
jgi:hypothetical protein